MLAAVPDGRAGIASGVNNGVARAAGLLVVTALPLLANLPQDAARSPGALSQGFQVGMLACAGLFVLGAVVAWCGIGRSGRRTESARRRHCTLAAPTLEPPPDR